MSVIKFPDVVPVGSQLYTVRVGPMPGADVGACEDTTKEMWIDDGQPPRAALRVFFHEDLHAIENEYGVKLSHADLDRIAQGIVQAVLALVEAQ